MSIKYKKYLTLLLLIGLFFPQLSQAALPAIGAVIGAIGAIGSTLETIFEPILAQLLVLTVILALSVFIFWTTMSFLTIFIDNQSAWIEQLLPVTQAAFDFVVGIANMFVILVFVVIAFAFILKIETFQAKKTLPRLIIVALLMNFSLLFVNMLIDLSQVIYNTILQAGGIDLFIDAFQLILSKGMGFLLGMYITMTLLMGLMGAPVIGKIVTAIVGLLAPPVLVPMMTFTLFLALFLNFLATPLAILAFLFAARIFVLQILGIVAPLAFLCLVLPQTKKHFDEWLSHLVEWLMLGIVGLFLLSIGFSIIGLLQADVDLGFKTILGLMVVPIVSLFTWTNPIEVLWKMHNEMFVYFFAMFVYMCIVIYILGKNMPTLGKVLIDQGKGLMGNLWSMGVKPFASAAWRQTKKTAAESEDVQRIAERMATSRTPELRGWRRLATPLVAPFHMATRGIGRAIGPGAVDEQRKQIDATEKNLIGQSVSAQVSAFRSATTDVGRIAALNAMSKDKNIDEAMSARFGNSAIQADEIQRMYVMAQNRYGKHSALRSAFPDIAANNLPAGTNTGGLSNLQHVASRMRPSDYENVSRRTLDNDDFVDAVLVRGMGGQVSSLVGAHQQNAAARLETRLRILTGQSTGTPPANVTANEMRNYLQNVNPRLHRYFMRGGGQGLINI